VSGAAARWLADLVLVLHLTFIVFVVAGGLLVLRRPRWAWVHVPVVLWGAFIEFTGGVCPLTPLEVSLRQRAGDAGYAGGFIEHYIAGIVYPDGLSRMTQALLGLTVVALNGLVYLRLWRRRGAETRPTELP
jgi:hypothetical protein